jgi:hypothetical protein
MVPDSSTFHAVMQSESDILWFIARVIAIVTAVLALSRMAYGFPAKGDHRSATSFLISALTVVFFIAAMFAAFSTGLFSLSTEMLYGGMFLTQVIAFFLEVGPPTRQSIFNIVLVVAMATTYISLAANNQNRQTISALIDSYAQTSKQTLSTFQALVDKLKGVPKN